MTSWLQRQRKADLIELADEAGLQQSVASLRKEDMLVVLHQHLRANADVLANNPTFDTYYSGTSPIKKRLSNIADDVPHTVRSRGRPRNVKTTLLETEFSLESSPTPSTSTAVVSCATQALRETFEPATAATHNLTSNLQMSNLPSPTAVADLVERRTSYAADNVRKYYTSHRASDHIASAREALANVFVIDSVFILFEAWGLQRTTLPWKYAFSLPPTKLTKDSPLRVNVPDFFVLLESLFWGPTLLWVLTSILLPMFVGYLINFRLTKGKQRTSSYSVDPLVFNIAKILVTWLVYYRGITFWGLFAPSTVFAVGTSVPGGPLTVVLGAAISAVFSIYDAILDAR